MPPSRSAGNVLRPSTTLTLSLRIPPTADHRAVLDELRTTLEADPPYGASVRLDRTEAAPGWNAPDLAPWLREALDAASNDSFGRSMQLYGEGGTIPFMGMLGERFPAAQFVITGVLGPGSNAHGPNEFLDVAYAEKLTGCLARVLDRSCRRP
jgi:acetylornithine deacetylase/succinyl-diaminopimelate desuccinylase-like protein